MEKKEKKRVFLKHKKSSALVVSIIIHAVFFLVAVTFVAVSVVKKNEIDFEAKEVKRPKMNLRKLQVPVDSKKMTKPPKLRKQIIAKPNINKNAPDIKLPEIVGVKGGLGAGTGGFGAGNSLGFTIPDISFFGVKGKAERIMIILDGSRQMNADSLGGAYGYEVIKKECIRLIDGLPSTAVFNIVVYDWNTAQQLLPDMGPASAANKQRAKDWLMPLNAVKGTKTSYGYKTLGEGGTQITQDWPFGKFKEDLYTLKEWNAPVFQSIKQQADSVFLLTYRFGTFLYDLEDNSEIRKKWDQTSEGKKWAEMIAKAQKALDEDNANRKAAGEPPSSLRRDDELGLQREYFPDFPYTFPAGERARLEVVDLANALKDALKSYSKEAPKLGIKKKSQPRMALNVILFKQLEYKNDKERKYIENFESSFRQLVNSFEGELVIVAGLDAIKHYADPSSL